MNFEDSERQPFTASDSEPSAQPTADLEEEETPPWLHLNPPVPWEELDQPIRDLVRELSNLPGIVTLSSCGGHDDAAAKGDGRGPEHWDVYFRPCFAFPEDAEAVWPDEDGWLAVEFLTWVVHDLRAAGRRIWIDVDASAPFLNGPGRSMKFIISGVRTGEGGYSPEDFIADLRRVYLPIVGFSSPPDSPLPQ
jgi:hypothetical protein